MEDKEAQDDELLVLASIYDELTFSSTSDGNIPGGHFAAYLDLPTPFHVKFSPEGKEYEIQYLPPVMLYFDLPEDYPSNRSPSFTLSCKWLKLSQLSQLCARLDEIWEENKAEVVLFMWTSFLKDEVVDYLHITSPLNLSQIVATKTTRAKAFSKHRAEAAENNDSKKKTLSHNDSGICDTSTGACPENLGATGGAEHNISCSDKSISHFNRDQRGRISTVCDPRAIQDIASQDLLLPTVLEHDASHKECVFKSTLYTCEVCFQEKLGALCIQFVGCNHVYCKECMTGYFTVQINEGNVKALTCPMEKCESQAHPSQVSELVGKELFSRYDRLLLQTSLDTMSDIVYCPRKDCNCPVMVDTDNMGSCSACNYVFCVFCKMVYHGVSPCKLRPDELRKLRTQYEAASPAEKIFMEQKYGKQVIKKAIQEMYTQEWLEEFSKKCPHCGTHIQKVDGCNKMFCSKCHIHFCWLCNSRLPKTNPYHHFGDPDMPCFNKLFLGDPEQNEEELEDEWYEDEEWFEENGEREDENNVFYGEQQDDKLIITDVIINNEVDLIEEDLIVQLLMQHSKENTN